MNIRSFGIHSSGLTPNRTEVFKNIAKVFRLAQIVTFVAFAILGAAAFLGFSTYGTVPILGVTFVGFSLLSLVNKYYWHKNICRTAGLFLTPKLVEDFKLAQNELRCHALPTENCADTQRWREKLVEVAEHQIVISGCYCGGESFLRLLSKIEVRMAEKPDLKVIILSSPIFLKNEVRKKTEELQKKNPNFSLIETPDIWHLSPGLKKSTNHCKGMTIDYGKYFLIGGSPIKDAFAETGIDDLSKEEFFQKRDEEGLDQPPKIEAKKIEDLGKKVVDEDGWLKFIVPGIFRDMDYVFGVTEENQACGKEVYQQLLLLAYRWEEFNKSKKGLRESKLNPDELALFSNKKSKIDPNDSMTVQLLKTPVPLPQEIKTQLEDFDKNAKKADNVRFKIFSSGPEQKQSAFTKELILHIEKAEREIVIAHMYFHPPKELKEALIEAARRGVKIKIISCGVHQGCSVSHHIFGPRNKYNYAQIFSSLTENEAKNVEIYEFQQKRSGFHKKIILVDDTVIGGNSNLGYKSLVSTSDHELNFFAQSAKLAKDTKEIFQVDIEQSKKVEHPIQLTVHEQFMAHWHRLFAPLFG